MASGKWQTASKRRRPGQGRRFSAGRAAAAILTCYLLFAICSLPLASCATETKVIKYHPMLAGLPGSQTGTPVVRGDNYVDPTVVPPDKLVVEDPVTHKKVLTAKSGRHLMVHIYNAITANDKETFVDQILSTASKQDCADRGVDPGECFDELVRRKEDVFALFNAMPGGEGTPGVYVQNLAPKVERIKVEGLAAQGLAWTGMDMVMEKGNWKLRWFVQ